MSGDARLGAERALELIDEGASLGALFFLPRGAGCWPPSSLQQGESGADNPAQNALDASAAGEEIVLDCERDAIAGADARSGPELDPAIEQRLLEPGAVPARG